MVGWWGLDILWPIESNKYILNVNFPGEREELPGQSASFVAVRTSKLRAHQQTPFKTQTLLGVKVTVNETGIAIDAPPAPYPLDKCWVARDSLHI